MAQPIVYVRNPASGEGYCPSEYQVEINIKYVVKYPNSYLNQKINTDINPISIFKQNHIHRLIVKSFFMMLLVHITTFISTFWIFSTTHSKIIYFKYREELNEPRDIKSVYTTHALLIYNTT